MAVLLKEPPPRTATCQQCGCEFSYTFAEVKSGSFGCFDDFETKWYVICPYRACGIKTFVPEWKAPRKREG